MTKKIQFSALITLFLILSTGILAEAGTARFPVVVKWDASARVLAYSNIYIVNLKGTPVDIDLDLYKEDGTLIGCSPYPPTITIPANGTKRLDPSGCFAITLGVPLTLSGSGKITSSSNGIAIYWRIYDQTVTPTLILDGREIPTATGLPMGSPSLPGNDLLLLK
jgi:hypothetical protein